MANPSMQDEDKVPSAEGSNRRRQPRKSVIEAELVTVDLGQDKGALLLDVSEDGMGVQALSGTHQGATVPVGFELPDTKERVEGTGLVVWNDQGGRVGVLFRDLAASAKTRLRKWLSNDVGMPVAATSEQVVPSLNADEADALQNLRDEVASLAIDSALAVLAERTRGSTRGTGVAIALSDGTGFICRANSGHAPDLGVRLHPSAGLSGECIRTGQIVRCEDTETDPRADRIICRQLSLRSAVILPLRRGAEMVGVLEAFSDQAHAFESADVLFLRRVGELIVSLAYPQTAIAAADAWSAPGATPAEILKEEKPPAAAVTAAPRAVETPAAKPAPEPVAAPRPAAKPEAVIPPLKPAAVTPIQPQPKPAPPAPEPTPMAAAPPLPTLAPARIAATPPAAPMAAPVPKPAPASTPPTVAKAVPVAPAAKAAEPTPRAASPAPARGIPELVPAPLRTVRPAPEPLKQETALRVPERKLEPPPKFDDYVPPSLLVKTGTAKKSHLPYVLVMLLVGAAVGGGGWIYYQKWQAARTTVSPVQQSPAKSAPPAAAAAAPVTTPTAAKTLAPAIQQQTTVPPKTVATLPAAVRQTVPRRTAEITSGPRPTQRSSPPATRQESQNPTPTPPPAVTTASLTPAEPAPSESNAASSTPSEAVPSPNVLAASVQPAAAQPPLPQPVAPTPAPPSPKPAASPPVRVSQGITGGKLTQRIEPIYPAVGRALGLQGVVVLHATVSTRGTVGKVTVVKGNAILANAAVEAVKRWRYEPYKLNGQAVEMDTDITFNFTMPRP